MCDHFVWDCEHNQNERRHHVSTPHGILLVDLKGRDRSNETSGRGQGAGQSLPWTSLLDISSPSDIVVMARSDSLVKPRVDPMRVSGRLRKRSKFLCLTLSRREICLALIFLVPNVFVVRSLLWLHLKVLPQSYSSAISSSIDPTQVFETLIGSLFPCQCHATTCECQMHSHGHVASPAPRQLRNYSLFEPDYATLHVAPLTTQESFERGRSIARNDAKRYHNQFRQRLVRLDDTTDSWDPYYEYYEEQSFPSSDNCYRPKWTYETHPSCNTFHEQILLERPVGVVGHTRDMSFLGQGHFRLSFLFRDVIASTAEHDDFVLKPIRFARAHDFNRYTYDTVQLEALSMDRSSSSHRTIDIYGHCGASVLIEPGHEVYTKIRPEKRFIKQEELDMQYPPEVLSYNNLTEIDKVLMALAMAEGLAEQHGNRDGVLINDDIQIQQFLVTRSGDLKLNDFNNVRPLQWNPIAGQYCPYKTTYNLLYRSPEERNRLPTDESSDVYALGQVLYTLLTGMYPFYETGSYREALQKNKQGKLPFIDPRYRTTFLSRKLVQLMKQTWATNRFNRPSVFAVVEFLRTTIRDYELEHNASLLLANSSNNSSSWSFQSLVEV